MPSGRSCWRHYHPDQCSVTAAVVVPVNTAYQVCANSWPALLLSLAQTSVQQPHLGCLQGPYAKAFVHSAWPLHHSLTGSVAPHRRAHNQQLHCNMGTSGLLPQSQRSICWLSDVISGKAALGTKNTSPTLPFHNELDVVWRSSNRLIETFIDNRRTVCPTWGLEQQSFMAPIVILGILRRVFSTQSSMNPREKKRKRRPHQSRTSGGMGYFSNDGPSTISIADGQPKENRCQLNRVILRNAERVNDIRCLSKQREENSTRPTGDFDSRTQCQSPGWPSNGVYSLKWRLTERYPKWGTLADPRPGRAAADQWKSSEFLQELRISGFPRFGVSPTCFRAK